MSVPGHRPYAQVLWVRNPDVMTRSGAFGVLVLAPNGDRPLLLEGTGINLWRALSAPKSAAQLAADLADQYGVEITVVEPDVHEALEQLRAGAIVVPAEP